MKKGITIVVIIILIIIGLLVIPRFTGSTALDGFAQCIADSGAKFYGAWWCPHCREQKEMFGRSERLLPYIECSGPNQGGPQKEECNQANIEGYPTWVFADSSRLTGQVPLETLAQKTGCTLPTPQE
jgi:thiol-disulfide isomerase/thioredoxin